MDQKKLLHIDITQLILPLKASIRDAIAKIDHGHAQIALVVDDSHCLVGTITDGDIRRALLRGENMDAPVERVMRSDYYSLPESTTKTPPESTTKTEALHMMQRNNLRHIPIINSKGQVVNLFMLGELIQPTELTNTVVIMVGGEGKRLRPHTDNCPKPMLLLRGKPMLEIILERCISAGFHNFYFAVNYLKNQIIDYFGDGRNWKVKINYLSEDRPLGTAGALSLLPLQPSEPFLVLNGDIMTEIDYGEVLKYHYENKSDATLCVYEYKTQIPYGVVRIKKERVFAMEEKPVINHHVNAGIYLLDPKLLNEIPKNQFLDMPELFKKAINLRYNVNAFPIHEHWLDIGSPENFKQSQSDL